jgi:hypothetical protein
VFVTSEELVREILVIAGEAVRSSKWEISVWVCLWEGSSLHLQDCAEIKSWRKVSDAVIQFSSCNCHGTSTLWPEFLITDVHINWMAICWIKLKHCLHRLVMWHKLFVYNSERVSRVITHSVCCRK